MAVVKLAQMTGTERAAFADAQIEDYAVWLLGQGDGTTPTVARARAQAEIEAELGAAVATGDLLWTATSMNGRTVGWLWVKRAEPGLPPGTAFLYQILVVLRMRRQGFGRAMLAALEAELASLGFRELHLNLWDSNTSASQLYATAGYVQVEQLPGKRHLRKALRPA